MGCGLPANGTFNGAAAGANAVLLDDDCNALITETVSTRQHCPLCTKQKPKHNKTSVWGQRKRKTVYQSMINYIFIEKLCYFHDIHKIKEEFYNCCTPAAKKPEF